MGWHIGLVKNDVVIDAKIARALYKTKSDIASTWNYDGEQKPSDAELLDYLVGYKDRETGKVHLYFNDDHMEHMDYLHDEVIQKVLCKHKVKGDICFGSLDGDNAGSFWGYRFDGKGGVVELKGTLVFEPEETVQPAPKKGKKTKKIRVCSGCYGEDMETNNGDPAGTTITKRGSKVYYCEDCGNDWDEESFAEVPA